MNKTLINGDMLVELDKLEENSIDCIITDPPYELGFMGKSWDSAGVSFQKSTWEKCLRVLKPGGYLLCFGGSRTFHRIACAIEDAGFEIRDTVMWIYGCYSDDTQVLTDSGWKYFYELDKTEMVLQWDKDTGKLSWIKPLNYFEYDVDTEMCLFENRHISQLVTQNHKVAVSVKARRKNFTECQLLEAQDIKKSWILRFPLAGVLDGVVHERDAYIIGWWLTDAWKHKDGKACMFSQCKPQTLNKLKTWLDTNNVTYSEHIKESKNHNHKDEHIFYVTGEIAGKLLSEYADRKLTWRILNWDKESRLALLHGLMDGDGSVRDNEYSNTFWSNDPVRCDIVQALCLSLNYRSMLCYKDGKVCGVVFNTAHNSTETQTKHRKPNVPYTGKVYCLQTETGAFVVRRNGKSFISGNSGFPKSMNIGLAIDKFFGYTGNGVKYSVISNLAKQWEGWGTSLKPAFEPIIVSRKPLCGTVANNVMTYGVGGINIDECRVPTEDNVCNHSRSSESAKSKGIYGDSTEQETNQTNGQKLGRFPANIILTYDDSDFDEVCGGFPITESGVDVRHNSGGNTFVGDHKKPPMKDFGYSDGGGSSARYFYCAKASKRDRDGGLDLFDAIESGKLQGGRKDGSQGSVMFDNTNHKGRKNPVNPYAGAGAPKKNIHPTVKPTSLMQYLVRLVAPKGATILDPFMGSGSTGKAIAYENNDRGAGYSFIGIEIQEDYFEIAKARISFAETDNTPHEQVIEEDHKSVDDSVDTLF